MSTSVSKRVIKQTAVSLLYHFGYFEVMRYRQRKRIIILMYHRFSKEPEPFKIGAEDFEKQILFLRNKYNIISCDSLSNYFEGKNSLPNNPLIITIDDGYYDNYSIAYPLLKKYSVPAMIFLTTDFITHKSWLWSNKLEYILKNSVKTDFTFPLRETTYSFSVNGFSSWHRSQLIIFNYLRTLGEEKDHFLAELADFLRVDVPELSTDDFKPLDWLQILEMKDNRISFGSHTCSHPILSAVSGKELKKEISDSKKEIESRLETNVDIFCYPNGKLEDLNDEVLRVVEASGYLFAVTSIIGFNCLEKGNRYLLKRCSLTTNNRTSIVKALTRLP